MGKKIQFANYTWTGGYGMLRFLEITRCVDLEEGGTNSLLITISERGKHWHLLIRKIFTLRSLRLLKLITKFNFGSLICHGNVWWIINCMVVWLRCLLFKPTNLTMLLQKTMFTNEFNYVFVLHFLF